MLDLNYSSGSKAKCYFTGSALPAYVNHEQPSTKKRPFSTIQQQTFSHSLRVLLPATGAASLEKSLANGRNTLHYLKVYMKLSELIEGDFFKQYIKLGNVLMLSEGRPSIDHIFSLCEGVLRLEIDKPTFERMGLEGKAIPNEGRKHVKARYAVEINLRLPSMFSGKSGFQRIVWAFQNVLNHSVTWLFCDLKGQNDGTGPISVHQPIVKESTYQLQTLKGLHVPALPREMEEDQYESAVELLEWLALTMSQSPRVQQADDIDPYLSRYRVPELVNGSNDTESIALQDLVIFQWRGLVHPAFVQDILLATLKASGQDWFALSIDAFNGKAYTVLQKKEQTMTWEYQD